eukprot:7026826-Karenia_brevis.AAC.1
MALESVVFPRAVFTDCMTVHKGVQQSAKWASSAQRRYARIWTVLRTSLDDGADSGLVAWMPAHTSAKSVDNVVCSDGTCLTAAMRDANAMADQLAKRAAEGVSVGWPFRKWLRDSYERAKQLAIYVGKLTYAAGAHVTPSGQ